MRGRKAGFWVDELGFAGSVITVILSIRRICTLRLVTHQRSIEYAHKKLVLKRS
jgi:hypothetical protein